ncbi:sulfatase family protein [Pelagicoccus mobilis]|uniref:Sulfatase n=1 Tax=Pelagicoccus mobilis TaxID=415221 RepID=A0A934VPF2_9BACT|nr:sulfatase [Pelagicoccus mobilis]MBK1875468.1 sulfatase [Pelagicoccus mobilis]
MNLETRLIVNRCRISIVSLLMLCFGAYAAERPNVVLIIGDDVSPDFSCYGGQVETPHIDQLAKGGLLFENAYVTASSCSPSRCSIITGRYPHNTGAPELHMPLPEGQFMFPQALKNAGYYSVLSGKWHMGEATRPAFDVVDDIHYPDEPTGAANWVRHLQERPMDNPFFMWFAALDAHRPWEADTEERPHDPSRVMVPAGVPDTPIARTDMASYYDEVRRFDRFVGDVVEELKTQEVYENTLIIVLADNGRPFPRSKTSLYDGGMKTPLVVHWPEGQFEEGARSGSLVSAIDIAPAILEVAGLPTPSRVQGVSFLPICRDSKTQTRDLLFGERNWHTQIGCGRMVRWGDFVYMRDFTPESYSFLMVNAAKASYADLLRLKPSGKLRPEEDEIFSVNRAEELLFDVSKDPKQVRNLVGNPEMNATLENMRAMMDEWQERTGDSIPELENMTPDRHDRVSYERLYPGPRPSEGIVAGQDAGATEINDAGPIWK